MKTILAKWLEREIKRGDVVVIKPSAYRKGMMISKKTKMCVEHLDDGVGNAICVFFDLSGSIVYRAYLNQDMLKVVPKYKPYVNAL